MILSIKKLVLILFVVAANSFAQQVSYKKLNTLLDTLNKYDKLMGTMSIEKNSDVVFSKAVGFADIENDVNNTSKTKYRIGSITKTFTAVIIFQLIDEEKLNLETPLSDYFPKLPNASKITMANLLMHSSGLFNITSDKDFRTWMLKPTSQDQLISRMLSYEVEFEPGEKNAYSNTNFILLGYIAEAIDKQSYTKILKQRITSKIDLKDTYAGGKIKVAENESLSYSLENNNWQIADETDMSNPAGAGSIVSTADDITKFYSALFEGKLLSEESFKQMTTANGDYGHGIFTQELNGIRMYGHNGGIDGFQSAAIYIPEQKLALAILGNGVTYGLMPVLMNGVAASLGEDFEIPTFSKIELTEAEAKQYIGEYTNETVPFSLIFKAEGKNVVMEVPEQKFITTIMPTRIHHFTVDAMGIAITFDLKNNKLFIKDGAAETLEFKKL